MKTKISLTQQMGVVEDVIKDLKMIRGKAFGQQARDRVLLLESVHATLEWFKDSERFIRLCHRHRGEIIDAFEKGSGPDAALRLEKYFGSVEKV